MQDQPYLVLLLFVAACAAAAFSGAFFRPGAWYENLAKPSWRPPNWLFGPVWAVLYGMIAVSGWLVWDAAGWAGAAVPLAIYAVQLVLNALWSGIFFGLRKLGWAIVEMVLLWISILGCIVTFHTIHAGAAWLLLPYLVWVSFAMVLNIAVWRLNRPGRAVAQGS
jgi:translocator protein